MRFHPIYRTAQLQDRESDMVRLQSKGQFDPKFEFGLNQKNFDDKEYYDLQKYGLSVATWPGIDFKAAYKTSSGQFLNPQESLPENGGVEIGADANLLKGLLYDERRAALEQAQVFRLANEAERRAMLNSLNARAMSAYWSWSAAFARYKFSNQGLELADQAFALTKRSFKSGYSSEIDTVEALSVVLNRRMDLEKSRMDLRKAQLTLGAFIWGPDSVPVQLSEVAFPIDIRKRNDDLMLRDTLDQFIRDLPSTSPDLLSMQAKNADLDIQRKLALNNVLPEATVQYRWFTPSDQVFNNEDFNAAQNYTLGVGFSVPLFIRKERAYLSMNKIKRSEQLYKMLDKQNELTNKMLGSYESLITYWRNSRTAFRASEQFYRLLEVELRRAGMGESSLFRVNKRQDDLIKVAFKWIDNLESYELQRVEIYRLSGRLAY